MVKDGRICPVSEARSAVRRPARGGREPTPCLGGGGSKPIRGHVWPIRGHVCPYMVTSDDR